MHAAGWALSRAAMRSAMPLDAARAVCIRSGAQRCVRASIVLRIK